MITTILGWVAMPLVRWVAGALIGVLFIGFMRADAAAPWKQQVTELRDTIAKRDQMIKDYESAAELDKVATDKFEAAIESMTHDLTAKGTACVFTADELASLRRLAGGD